MELPKTLMNEDLVPAAEVIDTEDAEDLLVDCYDLLGKVLERSNPKWLQSDGLKLLKRIEVSLMWHRLH